MKTFGHFRRTRARLQRLTDAQYFTGWCKDITAAQLIVSVDEVGNMTPGEKFLMELFGHKNNLTAHCTYSIALDRDLILNIFKGPTLTPATENARVSVNHYPMTFLWEGLGGEASVVNMSIGGLGAVSSSSLKRGAEISLSLSTPGGEIKANGLIKYCRASKNSVQEYRLGIALTFEDRISKARWQALFQNILAA